MNETDWLQKQWFHAIDLGDGLVTPGRFGPDVPPNYTLYGVFDLLRHIHLTEARCVDVGTMDGIAAFVMKGLGAREVLACDMAERPTFAWARERLGLDVDYRTPVAALELPQALGDDKADLVLMAGVLYHVYDPLTVLVACRESLRREGLLLVETAFAYDEGGPRMTFNPADPSPRRLSISNVYWRPSKAALHGMLQLAGFEVLATRVVHARLTVLAQARRPKDIAARHDLVRVAQDRKPHPHYREAADFRALQSDQATAARVRYDGPRDDRYLYRAHFEPEVPFQPRWRPRNERVRWLDAAHGARMHATLRLAEARATAGFREALASGVNAVKRLAKSDRRQASTAALNGPR